MVIGNPYDEGLTMQENKNKHDGLPEIAEQLKNKKPVLVLIASILLIIGGSLLFHAKSNKKIEPVVDETYAPQIQSTIAVKKEEPQSETHSDQAAPITQDMMQTQILLLQEKQKELQQRLSAPLMLVNNKEQSTSIDEAHSAVQSHDPNTQFLNQLSVQQNERVNATNIASLSALIAEGSLIHAILEPATNSDLPGFLRAIVSEANFSEDGSHVLIPPGSRLIGQYKSGVLQGQSRIFIVWTRLITPDGVSVNLGSPGVDSLGVAGVGADEVDRHFWERFGTASLLSLIGAGAANSGVSSADQENSAAMYRAAVASSFAQSAGQSLQQDSMIAPTLKTYQGKPIIVFVAHDIHFEGVMKQSNSKVKIF